MTESEVNAVARVLRTNGIEVTAMHPGQRCTVASVAGHAMYERSNPYFEHVAGGYGFRAASGTAEACARTLKRAGAARVELVSWARVVRPTHLMR